MSDPKPNLARVTLRLFATLRERRGTDAEVVEVPEGTTAAALYASLFPAPRVPVGFAINLQHCRSDQVLLDGDELALLPPLGGG